MATFCSLVGPFVIQCPADRKGRGFCSAMKCDIKMFRIFSTFQKVALVTAQTCLKASASGQPRSRPDVGAWPFPSEALQELLESPAVRQKRWPTLPGVVLLGDATTG